VDRAFYVSSSRILVYMIGAIVFELRALNSSSLLLNHGQQLHGLCFKILEDFSPALSTHIHNHMSIKPFTLAELESPQQIPSRNNRLYITKGTVLHWRVTALQDEVLQAFLSLQPGHIFALGNLHLQIERVLINPEICAYTGLVDPTDMLADFFSCTLPFDLNIDFHSVTTFRSGTQDYPWPLPEFVFGSLADKWTAMSMPGNISAKQVRDTAADILPLRWQGKSCRITLSSNRSATGFVGQFTYSLAHLSSTDQQLIALLAAYAEFSGVGRWTAHGLGQVRIKRNS